MDIKLIFISEKPDVKFYKNSFVTKFMPIINGSEFTSYIQGYGINYIDRYNFAKNEIIYYLNNGLNFNSKNKIKSLRKKVFRKRDFIYNRDNYTCYYCDEKFDKQFLSIDHILPLSKGGNNYNYNLITSCKKCNFEKSNMSFNDYIIKINKTHKIYI